MTAAFDNMNPDIEIWNGIALIRDDAYFTKWVKQEGRLDHHLGFLHYLRPFLGGTMIDVGANIGTHSTYYAEFGYVFCFEPNPIAYECLEYNMRGKAATLYNVAIGEKPGNIRMTTPEDGNYGAVYTEEGGSIPVITLDSLELSSCDYIKLDCEGDEIAAINGAINLIKEHKPYICVESNPETLARRGYTPEDLVALVHSLGYVTKQRVPMDISCDLICFPPGR